MKTVNVNIFFVYYIKEIEMRRSNDDLVCVILK